MSNALYRDSNRYLFCMLGYITDIGSFDLVLSDLNMQVLFRHSKFGSSLLYCWLSVQRLYYQSPGVELDIKHLVSWYSDQLLHSNCGLELFFAAASTFEMRSVCSMPILAKYHFVKPYDAKYIHDLLMEFKGVVLFIDNSIAVFNVASVGWPSITIQETAALVKAVYMD